MDFSLKDLLLVVPAWTGAGVALFGLRAWQRQLHGRENYDLARRLLRATYRYRDAFQATRSPFSFEPATSVDGAASSAELQRETWQRRWEPLEAVRRELRTELVEAEVLYGAQHAERYQRLFQLEADLYQAVLEHLETLGATPPESGDTPERRKRRRATLYARPNLSDDLSQALTAAVQGIEAVLRPLLLRPGKAVTKA